MADRRYYEEYSEGDEAPVLVHTLERTDLVRYAGLSGDYNPMHHDEIKATAAGQPSVFGHGMFSMGILGTALTNFVGAGNLTRYQVRFARQTWPGEVLSTRVSVSAKRSENGRYFVDLDCSLANQDGEEKVVGTATAEVESKNGPKRPRVGPSSKPPAPKKAATKRAPSKKAPAKKAPAKKVTAKKAPAKKVIAKKAPAKKAPAKKVTAKKSPAKRKATQKKTAAKKAPAKRPSSKRVTAKKTTARRATPKKATIKKTAAKKASGARKGRR